MRSIQLYSLVDRRNRREARRIRSLRRRMARFALGCAATSLIAFAALLLAVSLAYTGLVAGLPSLALLPQLLDPQDGLLSQPTRVYDRSGQRLLLTLENPGISRRSLPLDEELPDHLAPELVRVTVGAFDPRYFDGMGVSLDHLLDWQPHSIAERLADDLLLWREPRGLRRALRMRILAAQMVAHYGHEQVLEWYLNSASFGRLAFGADSAARLYLDKPATELTLAESALLVAAIQAPALNPLDAPQAALERQQQLLDQLLVKRVISVEEHVRAKTARMTIAQPPDEESAAPGEQAAAAFSRLALEGLARRFDRARLERGGLRIITTLDYSLQVELDCLVRAQLSRLTGAEEEVRPLDGEQCRSAQLLPTLPPADQPLDESILANAVILDPQTGEVLALLGDTDLSGERAWLSPRSPGSLLTPFVALAGFARSMSPATLVWDIPSSLPETLAAQANPDGQFHGPVRLRTAIANDYLAAQAQLLAQMGAGNVWQTAAALGLSGLSGETGPELLFSGGEVSALEVAQAYGVLAAQGARTGQRLTPNAQLSPVMVTYVEDLEGEVWLDARQPETQAVVSNQLAYLVHHVLSDSTARWPSLGYSSPLELGRPAAAKIGQVSGGQQVWTAGYLPQRVAVFWLGFPEGASEQPRLNPKMVAGMWHAWMQFDGRSLPPTDWPRPEGIAQLDVCDPSGLLPTAACPEVVREIFLSGSEPTAPDTLYQVFQINRETGRLATVFTPPVLIEEKTFLVVPPQAADWARSAGLPVPPRDYDAIQATGQLEDVRIDNPAPFSFVSGEIELTGTAAGEGFRSYQLQVGQGLNPQSWLQIGPDGEEPVVDGRLGVWDTRTLEGDTQAGLYAIRLLVVRNDQRVETTTIQVTVDNTPPVVRVLYPLAGEPLPAPADGTILLRAQAEDSMGIQRLVWLVDGREVGESIQEPFVYAWRAKPGRHTVEVRAYDLAGNEGTSETVEFVIED